MENLIGKFICMTKANPYTCGLVFKVEGDLIHYISVYGHDGWIRKKYFETEKDSSGNNKYWVQDEPVNNSIDKVKWTDELVKKFKQQKGLDTVTEDFIETNSESEKIEANEISAQNYVIVVDYDESNNYLDDQCLLGWNSTYDWFDTDIFGDDIINTDGSIMDNEWGLIRIDRWTEVYASNGTDLIELRDACKDANEEALNCTVCRIELNKDGQYIVIPV